MRREYTKTRARADAVSVTRRECLSLPDREEAESLSSLSRGGRLRLDEQESEYSFFIERWQTPSLFDEERLSLSSIKRKQTTCR